MKTKIKTETKMFIAGASYVLLMLTIGVVFTKQSQAYFRDVLRVEPKIITRTVEIEKKAENIDMKNWVRNEVESAGLNWNEVDCLIKSESGWNNWTYNINNNGSTDMGLWQINSIHKETADVECRFDYKCATRWAIQKRLNDGNWHAWYGYLYNCK